MICPVSTNPAVLAPAVRSEVRGIIVNNLDV